MCGHHDTHITHIAKLDESKAKQDTVIKNIKYSCPFISYYANFYYCSSRLPVITIGM